MKKTIFSILVILFIIIESFGHAISIERSYCRTFPIGPRLYQYEAIVDVSALTNRVYNAGINCVGQWVGPRVEGTWANKCTDWKRSCTLPIQSVCNISGTVRDEIISGCYMSFSGPIDYGGYGYVNMPPTGSRVRYANYSWGRGRTGTSDNVLLDPEVFSQLNSNGYSAGEIEGEVKIIENNKLSIKNLVGTLHIQDGTDFFSTLKVVVIKENINMTEEEITAQEHLIEKGIFNNTVVKGEINVSKQNIDYKGFFENTIQISEYRENNEFGVNIKDLSIDIPLEVDLAEDEILTVITYLDGGFDISSSVVFNTNTSELMSEKSNIVSNDIHIYPNPTNDNFQVSIGRSFEKFTIKLTSIDGRTVLTQSASGNSAIIDISTLASGMYFVEVSDGVNKSVQRLVKQ